MWVPWRLGGPTGRDQANYRARKQRAKPARARGGPPRGQVKAAEASARALKKGRQDLLQQAKAGKITAAQYRSKLRALERKHR